MPTQVFVVDAFLETRRRADRLVDANLVRNFRRIFAKVFALLDGEVAQRHGLGAALPDRLEGLGHSGLRQGPVDPQLVAGRVVAVDT